MTRRSLILDVVVRVVFHSAIVLGVFLLCTGHNRPGGGFVGGLVVGAAIALRYVAGGIDEVADIMPVRPWTLLGAGLILATGSALVPSLFGRATLEYPHLDRHVGVLGDLHVTGALIFDTGVALVVVGLALIVLVAFGERLPTLGRQVRGGER